MGDACESAMLCRPQTRYQLNLFETLPELAPPPATETLRPACDVVRERDLPAYPRELIELVDRSLDALARERVWFTYNDIKACFGVSRATVARRVKDRLVPGVRLVDGRVQEDGAVRRFDRTQLRWLLMAVRHNRSSRQMGSRAR